MGDFIVIAVLLLVLIAAGVSLFCNRKRNCSGGCASCEKRNFCHPEKSEEKNK